MKRGGTAGSLSQLVDAVADIEKTCCLPVVDSKIDRVEREMEELRATLRGMALALDELRGAVNILLADSEDSDDVDMTKSRG